MINQATSYLLGRHRFTAARGDTSSWKRKWRLGELWYLLQNTAEAALELKSFRFHSPVPPSERGLVPALGFGLALGGTPCLLLARGVVTTCRSLRCFQPSGLRGTVVPGDPPLLLHLAHLLFPCPPSPLLREPQEFLSPTSRHFPGKPLGILGRF